MRKTLQLSQIFFWIFLQVKACLKVSINLKCVHFTLQYSLGNVEKRSDWCFEWEVFILMERGVSDINIKLSKTNG